MIWIIASIPFWSLATFFTLLGGGSIIWVFIGPELEGPAVRRAIYGSISCLLAAGFLALIAAKICS